MDLSGWNIDLRALYGRHWKKRERFRLGERLFESPGAEWAVLLFGIGEIGMNKQVGKMALLVGKPLPRVVRHFGRALFWVEGQPGEPVAFREDGRHARLVEFTRSFWRRRELGLRVRILDCETGRLSD